MTRRSKRRSKASNASQVLASKLHPYQVRFGHPQRQRLVFDHGRNELGRDTKTFKPPQDHLLLNNKVTAEVTQQFLVRRNSNIQFFLVISTTIVFFVYYGFSMYEFASKGDVHWLIADVPPVTYFWKVVEHFVLQK